MHARSPRHVVALSGGGFTVGTHPELDDLVLSLVASERPRVCFVPTASSDSPSAIARFYERFPSPLFEPSHLELCRLSPTVSASSDFRERVLGQDLIYVGGGNTGDLLEVWARHDFAHLLEGATGAVLAGVSAGAACWFQSFVTDSFGTELVSMGGLGFVPGSFCPHYDSEPERRPAFHRLVANGMRSGYGADDAVALHFNCGVLSRVVAASATAGAYRVEKSDDGTVTERALAPTRRHETAT
jgi:dipeptidase E